jgi:hypothetical protein
VTCEAAVSEAEEIGFRQAVLLRAMWLHKAFWNNVSGLKLSRHGAVV